MDDGGRTGDVADHWKLAGTRHLPAIMEPYRKDGKGAGLRRIVAVSSGGWSAVRQ